MLRKIVNKLRKYTSNRYKTKEKKFCKCFKQVSRIQQPVYFIVESTSILYVPTAMNSTII